MSEIGKVLIVCHNMGVVVKGLERKLNEEHIVTEFTGTGVDYIEKSPSKLCIVYLTDELDGMQAYLNALMTVSETTDKGIIFLVGKREKELMAKAYPRMRITAWYDRALDMDQFAKFVKKYLEEKLLNKDKKKILIVDDDPTYAKMVREWLKEDYQVSVVVSGMQAISFLTKNMVDLILLDYEMPITNGPQVLQMLREDPRTAVIPVVFLTGVGDKESVVQVMALKPKGYILKSSGRDQIISTVKNFI